MPMREHFNEDLANLKESIKQLAFDAKAAFEDAIEALYQKDVEKAQQIIDQDEKLDELDEYINEQAILLIAKQQPFATDLRRLVTAIKISTDLERMADHAVNIAKSTIRLGKEHDLEIHPKLRKMEQVASEMVNFAIEAFDNEDVTIAKKLADLDDQVDDMYGELTRDMLEQTATNPQKIQHIMQMAFTSRYIERFCDHITNIGESIFYLVKGQNYDLNE